jgi:hypothetical protein
MSQETVNIVRVLHGDRDFAALFGEEGDPSVG